MRKKHQYIAWALVGVWMTVIFYLSHQPAAESSDLSSGITQMIIQIIHIIVPTIEFHMDSLHFFVRKGAHFFAYFTLGLLVVHALFVSRQRGLRGMLYALMLCALYATADEIHQLFIPGRSGEVADVLIDSTGASVGIIMYGLIDRFMTHRR